MLRSLELAIVFFFWKALGLPTEQVDVIKDVSLIKDVPVFYVEGSSTKPRCLVSLD